MERPSTSTSSFGVSRRENHDASSFYGRFISPEISDDTTLNTNSKIDRIICGDARDMSEIADNSVALVVTSPPYFAGKQYEEALGQDGVPGTYLDFLEMLSGVFAECVRVLEPGGRIAINVANLGRRPYRSLAADVVAILQDDLRLLLRGEIIWLKQRGASGSCAWGSFQRPTNPVFRDLTERVIVASKGRFDRAVAINERQRRGLPAQATMTREDFMENTLDLWEIPPESATRIGHPAPFPIELPARLIELFTFKDDLVLDPFIGAGSTAVAAVRLGRHYLGYDLDQSYIDLASSRIAAESEKLSLIEQTEVNSNLEPRVAEMIHEGRSAIDLARELLRGAGFAHFTEQVNVGNGLHVSFAVHDQDNNELYVMVVGGFTHVRSGLNRPEVLWRSLGQAAVIHALSTKPVVMLSAGIPEPKSPQLRAIMSLVGDDGPIAGVIDILNPGASLELKAWYKGPTRSV